MLAGMALAILALMLAFALVSSGPRLQQFDESVLLALRSGDDFMTVRGPLWIGTVMLDVTALGGSTVVTLVVVLVTGFLCLRRQWLFGGFLTVAAAGGGALSVLVKDVVQRARPSVVPHLVVVDNPSFPSGHSMLSAAVYLALGLICARLATTRARRRYLLAVMLLLVVLVGASRVYLGVHYASDVLAGWLGGAAWTFLCWQLVLWFERERKVVSA